MVLNYNRPLPASINTTPQVAPFFPINIGQIVRLVFQQPYNGSIVGTEFATMSAAQTLATWVTNIAATDGTAMFYTPLFSNSKIVQSKPLQTAADSNLTYRGTPEFFGMGGSELSAEFRAKDAPSLTSMAALGSFSMQNSGGLSNLSAYLVNQDGDVIGQGTQNTSTGVITNILPINLFDFWYGTMSSDGYATGTVTNMGLWLPPYWSDNLVVIPRTPTFDLRLLK